MIYSKCVGEQIICEEGQKELVVWNEFLNTEVNGGVKNSTALDVEDCKNACELNISCDGLDWHPGQSEGDRCWLHGSWSGQRVDGTAIGITHYDINRTEICCSMLLCQKLLFTV